MTDTFLMPRSTAVGITDITLKDIRTMSRKQLHRFAKLAIVELGKLNIPINHSGTSATVPIKHIDGNKLGAKLGITSKYHYVYWVVGANQWHGSVTQDGHKKMIGYFDDELDAAIAVDKYLDQVGDQRRPRNRDEFDLSEPTTTMEDE